MPPARLTYAQIAADLRERIQSGQYPPGSRLPSYGEVGKLYSVGISTAQAAYRILRAEGLTTSEHGRGTFVADRPFGGEVTGT